MEPAGRPLGIIQSSGIGDIVIALPIARHFFEQGRPIIWPVSDAFFASLSRSVPWVGWHPVSADAEGKYLYQEPAQRLQELGCSDVLCLYQALSGYPELSEVPWFQVQKFDEFKYTRAGVPFASKWTLGRNCLTRFPEREQALARKINPDSRPYVLVHLTASNYEVDLDLSHLPSDWLRIEITPETDSVFDWLALMEHAEALVMIDSIFANLADQLLLPGRKYWVPRSPIFLTPVLGSAWTILPPPPDSLADRVRLIPAVR